MKPSLGSFLTVAQTAKKLGVTSKTIREWCQTGRLPAITKAYGAKTSYLISPQSIEMLLVTRERELEAIATCESEKHNQKPHSEMLNAWEKAMAKGLINGRAFSKLTIGDYLFYALPFFQRHKSVSTAALKTELARIPAHQIAKRQHCFKAIVCLGKFLITEGLLEPCFLDEVKNLSPKRHLPPKRSTVKDAEVNMLLNACQNEQESLMIALLSFTGLRASEACGLNWGDLSLVDGSIRVRLGKGGKERQVGISQKLKELILSYRDTYPKVKDEQPILPNKLGKPMTRNGLYQRLERIGTIAGVKVSPHALRRAFVTINANKGRSLVILQRSCGHSDIKTTMGYCRTSEQEVIEAMKDWD